MNTAYRNSHDFSFFSNAQEQLEMILAQLQSEDCYNYDHGQIEQHINKQGLELLRLLFQGWLDLKATSESQYSCITSADGKKLTHVKKHTN